MKVITRRSFVGGSIAAATALKYGQAFAAREPDIINVCSPERSRLLPGWVFVGESQFDVHSNLDLGTSDYDPAKMVAAALAAFGGIGKFVKKGDSVVIKPNAAFAHPAEWATTTHPATVAAVAKACLDAKAKEVLILEFPQGMHREKYLERCGLTAALASLPEVKVKLLTPADFQKVDVKGGVVLKYVEVAKAVLSADVLINVPAAKQHSTTGVSLGLKNLMGLIKNREAFHTAMDIHQAIADLALVIKPQLTILDATRALLTNGPAGPGEVRPMARMVAGRKVASVDAYGLTVAKFNNKIMTLAEARHIELAGKAGLGETDTFKLRARTVTA